MSAGDHNMVYGGYNPAWLNQHVHNIGLKTSTDFPLVAVGGVNDSTSSPKITISPVATQYRPPGAYIGDIITMPEGTFEGGNVFNDLPQQLYPSPPYMPQGSPYAVVPPNYNPTPEDLEKIADEFVKANAEMLGKMLASSRGKVPKPDENAKEKDIVPHRRRIELD